MSIRPTQTSTFALVERGLMLNFTKLATAQEKVATGKQILRPSDDAVGTARALSMRRQLGLLGRFTQGVESGRPILETSTAALEEASGILSEARALLVQSMSGSMNPNDREAIGLQIELILEKLVDVANTKTADRYVFAGTATDQQPYSMVNGKDGLEINYHGNDAVQKISIIPRGNAGGLTFFTPSEERMESGLYSRTYLQNQMAVALGGRVAEEIVYGEDEVTTGASNDLQQVASVARQMVTRFGMSDKLGPVALGRAQGGMFLGRDIAAERDFSEDTAATIDSEVSDLVDVAYHRATKVLNDNRSVLDELAEMLVESETVDSQELQDLLIRRDVRIAEYV